MIVVASIVALALAAGTGCRKKTPEDRMTQIKELFAQQKIVDAVLKAKDLIREAPDDPASYEARGHLAYYYFQTGDPDRSHEYLEQIYRGLGMKDMRALQALMQDVQIYQMQEDYKAGVAIVDEALETIPHDAPTSTDLLMTKAMLLTQIPDSVEKGEAIFRDLMMHSGVKGQRDQAREVLAQHYRQQKEWQKVLDVYDEFEKVYPDDALKAHFDVVRGMALMKLDKTDEGEARFQRGIDALRTDAEGELEQGKAVSGWMAVAQYQVAAEKYAEAIKTFEAIREKFPNTQTADEAGVMIGDTWVRQKKYDEAVEAYSGLLGANAPPPLAQAISQRIQRVQQMKAEEQSTTGTLKVETTSASATDEETPKAAKDTKDAPAGEGEGEGAKKTP